MKKLIFLCLLALCLTTSCSKSKDNKEEDTASVKTVDLGEASEDENGDDADNNDEAKADNNNSKKKAKADEDKNDKKDSASDRDRKNIKRPGKDAKNSDSKPEKPAEADAPAKDEKPADADAPAKDEKPADTDVSAKDEKPAKAEKNDAPAEEGFDFSDDDEDNVKAATGQPPREPRPRPNLEIEKYINIREFREQTGYSGALAEDWLVGQRIDARYSSHRLATNNNSELGFSIQIWRPGNESAASKRFADLFSQSFGGQKIKSIASDAFTAKHHKINELGFFEKSKRATVLLSCSENICTQEQLKSIALIIQRRL